MQGYDREKALSFIKKSIDPKPYFGLAPSLDGLIAQAQDLDIAYMRENSVIDGEGYEGEGYYDDDDAFEYIVEEMVRLRGLSEEQAVLLASLVDQYMGAQEAYLKRAGLYENE